MTSLPQLIVTRSSRWPILACGAAAALLTTALAVYRPAPLMRQDYRVYDSLMRWARPGVSTGRIEIVEVDDRSVSEVGQWPWRRDIIGLLIDRIREQGAEAIVFDLLFSEPDRFQRFAEGRDDKRADAVRDPDAALGDSVLRGKVVMGYAMTFAKSVAASSAACTSHSLKLPVTQPPGEGNEIPLFRASGAICSLPQLEQQAEASGFLNAVPDVDGIHRRVPLLMERDGRFYPGLGLAAVLAASNARATNLVVHNATAMSLMLDDRAVPLDGKGNLLLRYEGKKKSFPSVSAADVLAGGVPADRFRGKLVFVGATALGMQDVVATPLDTLVSGVEIHATAADNLLQRDFLSRPDYALMLEALAVLGLTTVVTLIGAWAGLGWGAAAAAASLVVAWGAAFWAFSAGGMFLSPFFPTVGVAATFAAIAVAAFARERVRADSAASDLNRSQHLLVQSLLSMTEARDAETGRHSRRTRTYARMLATQLSEHPKYHGYLTRERIDLLASLAPLHDIGKIAVPDQILNKPGVLTPDEYAEIRKHPSCGRDVIVKAAQEAGAGDDPIVMLAKEIVYTHHERWDGRGYPQGLREEQIPISGRIVALVDVYDALVNGRVYRPAVPFERTVDLIVAGRGTHFDPAVVDAFLSKTSEFQQELDARVWA